MAVPEQTPYIEHTGNGVTTSFSLGFQCESKDHLIVLVDEIEPPIATWSLTGGNVVFTTAPAAGKKITLQRNTPFNRNAEYQSFNNSFRPQTVNIDFDRIWWKLQELGVADWLMKLYVDRLHQQQEQKIKDLKGYVDDRDDELRVYLMEEIRKQGVALDQLDDYYNYLMQRLAQIAVDKGWDASFVADASGLNQQQINNFNLTPFHFGAIGDGASHKLSERYSTLAQAKAVYPHAVSLDDEIDWCAVQALFDYVRYEQPIYLKYKIDISGTFMITRSLQYKPNVRGQGILRTIDGDFVGLCDNLDTSTRGVIEINTAGVQFTGVISIDAKRKADYGIWVSDGGNFPSGEYGINFGIKLGRCFIDNARIFNITFNEASMFSTLDFYRGQGGGQSYDTTVSNIVYNAGNGVSNGSTLNIDILPNITDVNLPIFIDYNGRVSTVDIIDTATKTITVSPALKTGGAAPNLKATIFYGGGIKTSGSDSAGILINQMSTVVDTIGLCHTAMYPCHINYFCSEFTKIAIFSGGLVGGVHIDTAYFEGDRWQYIQKTNGADFSGTTRIDYATGVEISKHDVIQWGRDPVTAKVIYGAGIRGYQLYQKGLHHLQRKSPSNEIPNGYSLDFNTPFETKSELANNLSVNFVAINEYYNEKFGYDTQSLVITGTGNNGAPTTVTFKPPVGYTLNGGSSDVVFSNFNAAAHFTAKLVVASKNIIISCNSLASLNLSVTGAIPPQYTDAAQLPVNTFYYFDVGSRTGLPSPSTAASAGNIKTYYSYGGGGTAHLKTQRVEFPEIHEVWERLYYSSTDIYFAWKLISHGIKKGTTAQRPSNPQLGMRYYDTTLLASGKPIEFNGVNWIDMTGTIV